jgi:amino acid transporter
MRLRGLCYAEFASMIPIAGSAYTYGYATLGEFVAWIIGWDLILEYLFAASTVAVGWSGYFTEFLGRSDSHPPPVHVGSVRRGRNAHARAVGVVRRSDQQRADHRRTCDLDEVPQVHAAS